MAVAATVWLGYEFGRLLFDLGPNGAVDLNMRHREVRAWFHGEEVYGVIWTAVYPPASYTILWPITGWLGMPQARWLYAFTGAAAVAWLVTLVVQVSGARSRSERVFVGLMPLSIYATGATIGNGQVIVYILPFLMTAFRLLGRTPASFATDLIGSLLVALALVKPSVGAPFLWIILFVPGRLRPALLTACAYVSITAVAISFQDSDLVTLMAGFRDSALHMLSHPLAQKYGHSNVHRWLTSAGLSDWVPAVSMSLFGGLGVWTFVHRRCDVWLLAGVAALVARFWTYHGWYDDLLILLPMISLFRIAKSPEAGKAEGPVAGALFAITLLTLMAPGGLYLLPGPWDQFYVAVQTVVWCGVLVFLLARARLGR
jgi:hypothetical protein